MQVFPCCFFDFRPVCWRHILCHYLPLPWLHSPVVFLPRPCGRCPSLLQYFGSQNFDVIPFSETTDQKIVSRVRTKSQSAIKTKNLLKDCFIAATALFEHYLLFQGGTWRGEINVDGCDVITPFCTPSFLCLLLNLGCRPFEQSNKTRPSATKEVVTGTNWAYREQSIMPSLLRKPMHTYVLANNTRSRWCDVTRQNIFDFWVLFVVWRYISSDSTLAKHVDICY